MKPKMSAAQLEARRKAGLSTSNPIQSDTCMQRRTSNAKPDCEEKRDPDKRSQSIKLKEKELDPDTQLEKWTFAADALQNWYSAKAAVAHAKNVGGHQTAGLPEPVKIPF